MLLKIYYRYYAITFFYIIWMMHLYIVEVTILGLGLGLGNCFLLLIYFR